MVDKQKYLKRFKDLHEAKTGEVLSDDAALEYFEQLIALVEVVYEKSDRARLKNI